MKNTSRKICAIILPLVLMLSTAACRKLDEDGGYYDEETKTYKYVTPTKHGIQKSALQVFSPIPGKLQQVYGIVTRIEADAKSFWLKIDDRKPYMILAESLSGGNRNDKTKELKIQLKHVSPQGSVSRRGNFRKKWRDHVIANLKNQMVNRQVLVEIDYEEKARKLWGICFVVVKTKDGDRARNINLWMIRQGLSYYFIDRGKAVEDKVFRNAQLIARKNKAGLWKYQ